MNGSISTATPVLSAFPRTPSSSLAKGESVAVFESVKAASDIYSPVSGEITEVNSALLDDLSAITPDRAHDCWLFRIKVEDAAELDSLMDEAAYGAMIA